MTAAPVNLLGLPLPELTEQLASYGARPFHARQLMRWMHNRGVGDFAEMTDLSKSLRAALTDNCNVAAPPVISDQLSEDGTRKWLFDMGNGQAIETVFIPEPKRGTLCVSSQVGCALDCSFCATGAQGFNRNLTSAEIIAQVWHANRELGKRDDGRQAVTNVVFMGMGEPLANYRNLVPALRILQDDYGYELSRRRVTVSTSGLVPNLRALADDANVALAVSLHAPNDALRDKLVPINKKHNIDELLDACWHYARQTNAQTVTFEYTMIDGVNDSVAEARALAARLRSRPAKVNLIPFNPFPGNQYRRSPPERIAAFRDCLHNLGIRTMTRKTRGDDIDAACGQLAGQVADRTRVRLGSKEFQVVRA